MGAITTPTRIARAQVPSDADQCASAAEESQPLRNAGKLTLAREKLLVCSRPICPGFVRNDCTKWLAEVERSLPSVVVRAADESGNDLTNVRVLVDGKPVAEKLDGRSFSVDPGEHNIAFESEGKETVTQKLLVREGEVNRPLTVTFGAKKEGPKGEAGKSDAIPLSALILGGAGAVSIGIGVVFWSSGSSAHSDMASGCAVTHSCLQSDVDSAKSKLLVGDVMMGLGVLALGAGAVIWLTSKHSTAQTPPSAASTPTSTTPAFDLRPVAGGGLATVGARF